MSIVSKIRRRAGQLKAKHFYKKMIRKNDLCFDIGANVGAKTEIFLSLGAKVIAVEPQSTCIPILNLLKTKYPDKLIIVQKAAADKKGKALLHLGNIGLISTLSKKFIEKFSSHRDLSWKKNEEVELTTLDEMIAEFGMPDFCKIDTEGYEKNVLMGLSQRIPLIEFEFTSPLISEAKECIALISNFGNAEFNYIFYEDPKFKMDTWCDMETILSELDNVPANVVHGNIYVRYKE